MELRQACEVKRFAAYEWGSTGLEREAVDLGTLTGEWGHAVLRDVLRGETIAAAIKQHEPSYEDDWIQSEQRSVVTGLTYGWLKFRWPALRADYDLVANEEEWLWEVPGLPIPIRLDLLLRHREHGALLVPDFKFLKTVPYNWQQVMSNSLQTQLYVEAAEQLTGDFCEGIQYEGLLKGARKSSGSAFGGRDIQQTPLAYAWADRKGELSLSYKAGLMRHPVWERPGVGQWLKQMPERLWQDQLTSLPPQKPPVGVRRATLQSLVDREAEYRQRLAPVLALPLAQQFAAALAVLERRTQQCFRYGAAHKCEFYEPCFFEHPAADPLGSGYRRRVNHHDTEVED